MRHEVDLSFEHHITYEVMRIVCCVSETVATFKTFAECTKAFTETMGDSKHASIDLVLRNGNGDLLFRQTLLESNMRQGCEPEYSDPYGWFGPSVFNKDYGYESYSMPPRVSSKTLND